MKRLFFVSFFSLAFGSLASAQDASEEAADSARSPIVDVGASVGIVSRHLRFVDDLDGSTRPYDLPAGATFGFDARVFPGALSGNSVASSFGVGVHYDRSVAVRSERAGVSFPTANQLVDVDLLSRWRVADHELIGFVGYGNHAFALSPREPASPELDADPDVPNVRYSALRIGAETRLALHQRLSLSLAAAYLVVFDAGGIGDAQWFPRSKQGGAQIVAKLIVPISQGVEARVGVEYRRYFFDMRPEPGDPVIAGGALDQYALARFELAYRY